MIRAALVWFASHFKVGLRAAGPEIKDLVTKMTRWTPSGQVLSSSGTGPVD